MKRRTFVVIGVFAATLLAFAAVAHGNKVMVGVPDWNQPGDPAPPPPAIQPPPVIADYPQWCSPTAGADLMGYWEDHYGKVGLTDRQVSPASTAYANNVGPNGSYQQGLWHDGTVELGWWMDTGSWRTNAGPYPPLAGVTQIGNIGPGLVQYAGVAYNDPAGIQKVAYSAVPGMDNVRNLAMWTRYMAEIDANRPVLVSFGGWVDPATESAPIPVDGQNVYSYSWSGSYTNDHTVCGVGYRDPTPNNELSGDEYFIVQDNWSTTKQYVMVPLDFHWGENDYITSMTAVPEPATLTLAALGFAALAWRRRGK